MAFLGSVLQSPGSLGRLNTCLKPHYPSLLKSWTSLGHSLKATLSWGLPKELTVLTGVQGQQGGVGAGGRAVYPEECLVQGFLTQLAECLSPLPQLFSEIERLGSGQDSTHRIPLLLWPPDRKKG